MNYIDVGIIIFIAASLIDGWRRGLLALLADLVALIISLFISIQVYLALAPWVAQLLRMPAQGSKILSFFLVAFILGSLLSLLFGRLVKLIPSAIRGSRPDKGAGAAFGAVKGIIYLGIVLLLLSSLPVFQPIKQALNDSRLAPSIIRQAKVTAGRTQGYLQEKFSALLEDTFALLTIKPGEGGVELGYTVDKMYVDEAAEEEMLRLVNQERTSRGLRPLVLDTRLRQAARLHSEDMFKRGYFAHESPEGTTPAERVDREGVKYTIMGENLALAPDVELAHKGLMNSPSHRENILFPDYRKIGIGAMNGGLYGIMFSQEFSD